MMRKLLGVTAHKVALQHIDGTFATWSLQVLICAVYMPRLLRYCWRREVSPMLDKQHQSRQTLSKTQSPSALMLFVQYECSPTSTIPSFPVTTEKPKRCVNATRLSGLLNMGFLHWPKFYCSCCARQHSL